VRCWSIGLDYCGWKLQDTRVGGVLYWTNSRIGRSRTVGPFWPYQYMVLYADKYSKTPHRAEQHSLNCNWMKRGFFYWIDWWQIALVVSYTSMRAIIPPPPPFRKDTLPRTFILIFFSLQKKGGRCGFTNSSRARLQNTRLPLTSQILRSFFFLNSCYVHIICYLVKWNAFLSLWVHSSHT
jgi:hypothetical protein